MAKQAGARIFFGDEAGVRSGYHAGTTFASGNTKKLLDIQLTKRNMGAHPSLLNIDGPQADDTISSLVTNVVLVLKFPRRFRQPNGPEGFRFPVFPR